MTEPNPIIIGVGGMARSGKDTFVKIARKILKENGYSSIKLAFADALKEEIDPFLRENYSISAWTDIDEEKTIIRPFLVAHGCGKREQSNGTYWVNKINDAIDIIHFTEDVVFISDCRFPNEVDWVHDKWGGWFVHLKKYTHVEGGYGLGEGFTHKMFDMPPNEEESIQDPICESKADYKLELENAIEREKRLAGNTIVAESLIDNTYLNNEIKLCLMKCPLLNIK
jgi:hypothetical protein